MVLLELNKEEFKGTMRFCLGDEYYENFYNDLGEDGIDYIMTMYDHYTPKELYYNYVVIDYDNIEDSEQINGEIWIDGYRYELLDNENLLLVE